MHYQKKWDLKRYRLTTILALITTIGGNLEGEVMPMSELNNNFGSKVFECHDRPNCDTGPQNREPSCTERRRMIGLGDTGTDKYVIVEAERGRTVQLECHYCHENERNSDKVWFYYEKFLASKRFRTVPLHLDYPEQARKFVLDDNDHRLSIRNFTEVDGALYFCQGPNEKLPKFNFLVDAIDHSSDLEPRRGSWTEYLAYAKDNVDPLNKKLRSEYKSQMTRWFGTAESGQSFNYNVSHVWSKWGKCRSCGRAHGVRMRTGTCLLSIPSLSAQTSSKRRGGAIQVGFQFSCHSSMLKRFLTSKLRQKVNAVADFVEELPCAGECPLSSIVDRSFQGAASVAPPLMVIGTVGEEVTLRCTDNPSIDIVWLRDNNVLTLPSKPTWRSKVTFTKNRGGVHFSSLAFSDNGTYTCVAEDLVQMTFKLDVQEAIGPPPIPSGCRIHCNKVKDNGSVRAVTWIGINLGVFSLTSLVIWIVVVICIARTTRRTQKGYVKISEAEKYFLKKKHALRQGYGDQSEIDV